MPAAKRSWGLLAALAQGSWGKWNPWLAGGPAGPLPGPTLTARATSLSHCGQLLVLLVLTLAARPPPQRPHTHGSALRPRRAARVVARGCRHPCPRRQRASGSIGGPQLRAADVQRAGLPALRPLPVHELVAPGRRPHDLRCLARQAGQARRNERDGSRRGSQRILSAAGQPLHSGRRGVPRLRRECVPSAGGSSFHFVCWRVQNLTSCNGCATATVHPTRTVFHYQAMGLRINLTFAKPVFIENLESFTPLTFILWAIFVYKIHQFALFITVYWSVL